MHKSDEIMEFLGSEKYKDYQINTFNKYIQNKDINERIKTLMDECTKTKLIKMYGELVGHPSKDKKWFMQPCHKEDICKMYLLVEEKLFND